MTRFTVDPTEIDQAVSNIISDHQKHDQKHESVKSCPISEAPSSPNFSTLAPMPWWIPNKINHGYFKGIGDTVFIWVDTTNHVIFFCVTD